MRYRYLRRAALGTIALVAIAILLVACDSAADQSGNDPTEVQISLSGFRIEASQTSFDMSTPYRFVIRNEGSIPHDWPIMPRGEIDESQARIQVHEDKLRAGATVTREFTFAEAGDFAFTCQVPWHDEAGALLPITVQYQRLDDRARHKLCSRS